MTTVVPRLPKLIDSTMLATFRSCPQKFYTEFVLGLRPIGKSVDLHAGGAFASSLERIYSGVFKEGLSTVDAITKGYVTFEQEWGDYDAPDKHAKNKTAIWTAIYNYIEKYPPHTDDIQPFNIDGRPTVEFSFGIPLDDLPPHPDGDPFVFGGRFDMLGVMKSRNNKIVIRDEKTAGRLESKWSEKWDLRSQFLGYCWAMQQVGLDVDTVVVRGIIITTKDIRYVEATKTYPKFLIERWYQQLKKDLSRMVACWKLGEWDYNLADACTNYSHCPFMPMCTSPEPSRWYNNYEVRRWNPLDRNPVTESEPPLKATGPSSVLP